MIARPGKPDRITVELAREPKLNDRKKDDHQRRIRRDTEAAIRRGKLLEEEGFQDTGANRALLRQCEELNPAHMLERRCPYCAEPIRLTQIFGGEADIDHIIPYSRSLDDSAGNKVLAHRHCNRQKGNKTPHEKWGHDPDKWDIISAQVARMHRSKQWRFDPDAMDRMERGGGFAARQLTDTRYLARLAGKYLRSLYPTAQDGRGDVIPGRMTAMLRRVWGLNSLLPDHNFVGNEHSNAPKNRLDHRHHAIDAAVAEVTSLALMQRISKAAARAEAQDFDRIFDFMARRVTSGDKENLEAQAARCYWPLLMGSDFRRNRDAGDVNAPLNYGYAVMRATCARALVAAGLHPTLGIRHSHRGNAFALADDLIEPFRPLVDALAERLMR